MKKIGSFIIILVVLVLSIPLFTLIGSTKEKPPEKVAIINADSIYKVLNHKTGEVMALSPTDYIRGVVAAEMPISYHIEALKAQAVAAHTYALREIDEQAKSPSPELKGAHLSTDPSICQAFISEDELKEKWGSNFDTNFKKLSDAVDNVINESIVYEDKPIIAAFHSISGGNTESAKNVWGRDVSYLSPVTSEGDELSPNYENVCSLSVDEVKTAFTKEYPAIKFEDDPTKWFLIKAKSESKTVTEIKVGSITLSGKVVREVLKLKSANFEVKYENKTFTFTTNGYGHGVGMSQYGADYLARQGKNHKEILLHYYVGVEIKDIYSSNLK